MYVVKIFDFQVRATCFFMDTNVTQVLKVIVHTEPKVMIELFIFIVLNGMLKSLYVQYIM